VLEERKRKKLALQRKRGISELGDHWGKEHWVSIELQNRVGGGALQLLKTRS